MPHLVLLVPALLRLACPSVPLPQLQATPRAHLVTGQIFVSGFESNAVHVFRALDGAALGRIPVAGPQAIVLGPDRLLYVCAEKNDRIERIDPKALAVVDVFVNDDPLTAVDENGPLDGPTAATFGPDGDLFVASFETDQILRYDGATGAYEGVFVTAGLGLLDGPDAGTKFGPDGLLYVPSFWNDRVLRYDANGAFVDEFVSFREGGLRRPRDLVHRKGSWYVASSQTNRILRFDAAGNALGEVATVGRPYALAFDPIWADLCVVSLQSNSVRVFAPATGAALSTLVPSGRDGLDGAVYLFFHPG